MEKSLLSRKRVKLIQRFVQEYGSGNPEITVSFVEIYTHTRQIIEALDSILAVLDKDRVNEKILYDLLSKLECRIYFDLPYDTKPLKKPLKTLISNMCKRIEAAEKRK